MRWPPWDTAPSTPASASASASAPAPPASPNDAGSSPRRRRSSWDAPVLPNDWSYYTSPEVLLPSCVIVAAVLTGRKLYRTYLRRIPGAMKISEGFFRKRSLLGRVTSVGDGDGCRLFHTPGGRLAGWGWLPGRRIPTGKALKDQTISIRIAGIDAPEAAHFGRPAQPGSQEALDWLTGYIKHARVRARIYRRDQYERAIATVYVRKWFIKRDVGYEMLKRGLATIYEAKTGSEFGLLEKEYREAEAKAKARKLGLWAQNKETFESPREYKTRMGMTPKDKEE